MQSHYLQVEILRVQVPGHYHHPASKFPHILLIQELQDRKEKIYSIGTKTNIHNRAPYNTPFSLIKCNIFLNLLNSRSITNFSLAKISI